MGNKNVHSNEVVNDSTIDVNNVIYMQRILEYKRFDKENIKISNTLEQSCRWRPYWEILYADPNNGIYYDYISKQNTIGTIDGDDIYLENEGLIIVNDKRFLVYDMCIIEEENYVAVGFPKYKKLKYKNPYYNGNNPKTLDLEVTMERTTTLSMNQSSEFYTEKIVNRTSIFVYYPNTTVYLLVDTNNYKIYAMQTMTNRHNPHLNETNLVYLKYSLRLPIGWMYSICSLEKNKSIMLISTPEHRARVINDEYYNSYQFIRPEEALFLYNDIFPHFY